MTDLFSITSKIQQPDFCFVDQAKFFGIGLATALVPSCLSHSFFFSLFFYPFLSLAPAHTLSSSLCFFFFPIVLFHSVKQLAVQENIALFVAVVLCTAFLLAVAYRAWAVFGSRRYMHRSDLLSHTFSQAETEERIAGIHRMGRIFAVAVVNVAYIALAFICSFQRIFGRFELSSFVSFLFFFLFLCLHPCACSHPLLWCLPKQHTQCVCSDGGCPGQPSGLCWLFHDLSVLPPRSPPSFHPLITSSLLLFLFPPSTFWRVVGWVCPKSLHQRIASTETGSPVCLSDFGREQGWQKKE